MKIINSTNSGAGPGPWFLSKVPGNYRVRLKFMQYCFLVIATLLIPEACRNKQVLNKSRAEKALRVFDNELAGKALEIMQKDGWDIFSGLLRSDSIPVAGIVPLPGSSPVSGNPPIPGSNPLDLSKKDNIFSSGILKIPLNLNQEYIKNGKTVCSVNFYYKVNPDSSFYVRKVLFIKPVSLEVKCFYKRDRLPRSGWMYLVISARDTSGNFLGGRIRVHMLTGNKGFLQAGQLHAEVSLFDLFFSADADFSPLKPGSQATWTDVINQCRIEVSDKSSSQYIGQLILEDKQKGKHRNFLFVFSDGSREPASAYFSWLSRLVSPD